MRIEEFSLGNSLIHRLDPRVKIISEVIFSGAIASNHSLIASFLSILFPSALIFMARISLRRLFARLAIVNGFIVFLWVFLPFTVPGDVICTVGPFQVTREGLHASLLITLKSNAIILVTIALLGTSSIFDLAHAVGHLGCPDKIVHLFFFSFRYLHVIHEEYHRLLRAAKARGFRPRTDSHTYRTYAYFVGMLLVRSFNRAGRILKAMKCRGFHGRFYILHDYNLNTLDYALVGVSTLISLVLIVLTLPG